MKTKELVALFAFIFLSAFPAISQNEDQQTDNEKNKSGWSFGAVPAIAYDTDIGFKYGGLVNFYHYGDGSIYPEYKHSLYFEWSRTTKGSGINQFLYDSKYLIPGIRTSGEISYLTEKGLDFYGYNGYKAYYNEAFEDDSDGNNDYLSRMFYRQERKLLRIRAELSGRFMHDNFQWLAGVVHYNIKLDTIDLNTLNEGTDDADKLPPINGGLYGYYKDWNILPDNEYHGGYSTLIKAGFVYDTRDNEPNPGRGIWSTAYVLLAPGIFGKDDPAYSKFSLTHRQYFTIVPDKLTLAGRLAYQGKLFGDSPSYMLPIIFFSGRYNDRDGLGGSKTLRGIKRNRVVGEDMAFGNLELRWKFLKTVIKNQNIYLALSGFTDLGMVTREYKVNTSQVSTDQTDPDNPLSNGMLFFPDENSGLHQNLGVGLHFALNENFIIAFDYGMALDEDDGDTGLYINMNWLF